MSWKIPFIGQQKYAVHEVCVSQCCAKFLPSWFGFWLGFSSQGIPVKTTCPVMEALQQCFSSHQKDLLEGAYSSCSWQPAAFKGQWEAQWERGFISPRPSGDWPQQFLWWIQMHLIRYVYFSWMSHACLNIFRVSCTLFFPVQSLFSLAIESSVDKMNDTL